MADLNILAIDDDPIQLSLLETIFGGIKYPECSITTAGTYDEFKKAFDRGNFDLVLSDYYMPDTSGKEILNHVKKTDPNCRVVIVTSGTSLDEAISLMKSGADDLIVKPVNRDMVEIRVKQIFELKSLVKENKLLLNRLAEQNNPVSSSFIYVSKAMENVVNLAARSAEAEANVLIQGESGTGKELLAKAIHYASRRKDNPFVVVNIAALSENLIESELFGHKKGAFTGAIENRRGRFEDAHMGTLFIDEAGDIPLHIQVKLLRVLQFGEFQRVGDNTTKKADVRIIAATSRNLEEMIVKKQFREDLYYRLNVIPVKIPPLRERKEDILPLAEYFLKKKNDKLGKKIRSFTEEAAKLLVAYSYPGNIRELENILEYALIISRSGYITSEDLPAIMQSDTAETSVPEASGEGYEKKLRNFETRIILDALKEAGGNQSRAARNLGISERKLRSRMTILNIENPYRETGVRK